MPTGHTRDDFPALTCHVRKSGADVFQEFSDSFDFCSASASSSSVTFSGVDVVVEVEVDGFFKIFRNLTFLPSDVSLFVVVVGSDSDSAIRGIWNLKPSTSCLTLSSCWCFWYCWNLMSLSSSSLDKLSTAILSRSVSTPASAMTLSTTGDTALRLDVGSCRNCC